MFVSNPMNVLNATQFIRDFTDDLYQCKDNLQCCNSHIHHLKYFPLSQNTAGGFVLETLSEANLNLLATINTKQRQRFLVVTTSLATTMVLEILTPFSYELFHYLILLHHLRWMLSSNNKSFLLSYFFLYLQPETIKSKSSSWLILQSSQSCHYWYPYQLTGWPEYKIWWPFNSTKPG